MLTTLIGIWISLTVISAGYIDYEVCNWVWGTQGASINCPIDSIGVGACGAGGNPDCSNGNFYTGLRCCQLVPYQTVRDCTVHSGPSGQELTCGGNHPCVYATCGSSSVPGCGAGDVYTTITCCATPELSVSANCRWEYGGSGQDLVCSTAGEVLAGRCGTGDFSDCPNSNSHGIRCCPWV